MTINCNDQGTGSLLSYDGSPISFDALSEHKYKVILSKIPRTIFFLQNFSYPSLSVDKCIRNTPFLDLDEVGEKIIYEPFTIGFLVDSEMSNYFEIYEWMKRMTKAGSNVGEVGDLALIVNDSKYIKFTNVWPTRLGAIQFVSNTNEPNYVTCQVTFNYDWFEIMSGNYKGGFESVNL